MMKLRKIAVTVSAADLEAAQACTGEGITATVREGLKKLAAIRAQQQFQKLRGTFKFSTTATNCASSRAF